MEKRQEIEKADYLSFLFRKKGNLGKELDFLRKLEKATNDSEFLKILKFYDDARSRKIAIEFSDFKAEKLKEKESDKHKITSN